MSLLKNLLMSPSPAPLRSVDWLFDNGNPWLYRKSLDINGTGAGLQEDYQVEIELDIFSALPANAPGFQTTPTSDATGQCVHPSILYFPDGWNGYKYWMAMTPYPGGNNNTETPEILACDDGVNWVVPVGLINPVVARDATNPNTDPCLLYNEATDEIWLYHRAADADGIQTYNRLYLKKSSDGIDWSGTGLGTLLLDMGYSEMISPSIVKVGATYHLWYTDRTPAPNELKHRTSLDGENWSAEETCNFYGTFPTGKEAYHLEVRYMTEYSEYWMLLIVGVVLPTWMMFVRSRDGTDWYLHPTVLLKPSAGWDNGTIYKASFLLSDSTLRIWYSGCTGALVWHVGYTTATIDTDVADMLSKIRMDCGDLRFTEDDKFTELDYWLESFTGGYILAWVKVANIPVAGTTIYVYYGKADETTISSIKNTSWNNIGDDFNDNLRDPTLWDELTYTGGSVAEANQRLEMTCPAVPSGAGYVSVGTQAINNVELRILANNTVISLVQLIISLTKVTNTEPSSGTNDWYKVMLYHHGNANSFYAQRRVSGAAVVTLYNGLWLSSEEEIKLRIENGTVRLIEQDTERANEAWALASRDCYIYICGRGGLVGFTGMDWADNFWARKYVSPEPTLGAWGSEESY